MQNCLNYGTHTPTPMVLWKWLQSLRSYVGIHVDLPRYGLCSYVVHVDLALGHERKPQGYFRFVLSIQREGSCGAFLALSRRRLL